MAPKKNADFSGIGCLFLLLLLAGGGYALWDAADEHGYIPHNKLTICNCQELDHRRIQKLYLCEHSRNERRAAD